MSTNQQLCAELKSLGALIQKRNNSSIADATGVVAAMVRSFCSKINAAHSKHMCADGALKLITALEDAALPDEHTASVQAAIDARVTSNTSSMDYSLPPPKRASQLILGQQTNYYTRADWAKLRAANANFGSMTTVLVNRLVRLGVGSASEQTIKWSVAIMLDVHFDSGGAMPTYQCIFMLVEAFKAQLAGNKKTYPHDHIVVYPETPDDLSTDMHGFAYDDDDPPICVALDRVGNIAHNHIPLRKNSNLLAKEREATEKRVAPMVSTNNIMERLQSFMDENSANRQAMALQNSTDRQTMAQHALCDRSRSLAIQDGDAMRCDRSQSLAIRPSTPPSRLRCDASDMEGCSPDHANAAEFLLRQQTAPRPNAVDFERTAFDALTSREANKQIAAKDKKRAKAAAKAAVKSGAADTGHADTGSDGEDDDEDGEDADTGSDTPPAKKPAVALKKPAVASKKPAAAMNKDASLPPLAECKLPGPVKDALKIVFAKGDKRSRAVFTSGAYHTASKVAKKHGVARYKCVAKLAFKRAAELFDARGKK